MRDAVRIEDATPDGPTAILGRASSTRAEWEAAREADAADLNRLLDTGGEVAVYVVPLWSNGNAERCLHDLRGFDGARVVVRLALGEDQEAGPRVGRGIGVGVRRASRTPLPSGGEGQG